MSIPRILLVSAVTAISSSAFAAATWNGTSGNWVAGDATIWDSAFANGNSVTFGGTTAGTITVDAGGVSPTSTTVNNTAATTFSGGSIGGTLSQTGTGALTLSSANSFTSVAVSSNFGNSQTSGAIVLGNNGALGSGTVTFSNTGASTMLYSAVSVAVANNLVLTSAAVRTNFVATNATSLQIDGVVSGGVAGGTFFVDTNTSGGSTGFVKLTNAGNTFTGTIQINRGGLAVTSDAALGNTANTIFLDVGTSTAVGLRFDAALSSARAIQLGGGTQYLDTGTNAVTLSGVVSGSGALTKIGTGALTVSGVNLYSGGTVISAGSLKVGNASALGTGGVTINAGGTLDGSALAGASTIAKAIVLGGTGTTGLTVLSGTGNGTEFSGNITGTTATLFLNTSTGGDSEGLVTLSGTNTFTATTGVQLNRGSLLVKSASALGASTNAVRLDSNGSANGNLRFDNSVTSVANGVQIITGGNSIAGTASGVTISGVISGVAWQKVGAGTTLTLTGVNTYTGALTVTAGALNVGAGGSVRINGANGISVASGASLAITGSLVATGITDTIANAGTLSGTGVLKLGAAFDSWTGGAYQLVSGAGTDNLVLSIDTTGSAVWSSASFNKTTGQLTFTAVPEPSAYGLLGAGALAGVALVRRRRKAV